MYTLMMNKRKNILQNLFLIIALSGLAPVAIADDDYIEAGHLLDSGKILPLEIILKKVRQHFPGRILDIELEREGQKIVYEIEILDSSGVVKEIYIDAANGELLSVEEDD